MPISVRAARRLTGLAAAAALVGGALTHSTAAQASSPTEGSINDTSTSASWGGGPFVAPNPSAQASGLPDCTVPQSCDDFTLHVSTPSGYGDTHSLKIDVALAADGGRLRRLRSRPGRRHRSAKSASSADPEEVVLPPTTGTYTVRVVPFLRSGQSYTAKATLVDQPATPPRGTATPRDSPRTPPRSRSATATTRASPRSARTGSPGRRCTRRASRLQGRLRRQRLARPSDVVRRVGRARRTAAPRAARSASTRSCSPTTPPDGPSSRS